VSIARQPPPPTSKISQNGLRLPPKTPLLGCSIASPRCDRCRLSRSAMQLTGRLMQAPSPPALRSFYNFNHLLSARSARSARSASMCLHTPPYASIRLYVPLRASLNPPQKTPTPSQGGTSDSNGRVRAPRYRPANHKNRRRALVCAICLLLDSLTPWLFDLDSPPQIMQLEPRESSRIRAVLQCQAPRTVDQFPLSDEASRRLACAMGFIRTKDNAQSTFVGSPSRPLRIALCPNGSSILPPPCH